MSNIGVPPKQRLSQALRDKGMSGDLVFVVDPATATPEPTAEAWTQDIIITLETSAGQIHEWFNDTITTAIAATDDSTAGTASMESTTLAFVNGRATAQLKGDAEAWDDTETATATVSSQTVLGYTVGEKTCVVTFTATGE